MSDSSTSRKIQACGFCHKGVEAESSCGQLYIDPDCIAHKKCMQYSALLVQYRTKGFGGFKRHRVVDEIKRGRGLPCFLCKGKRGKKSGVKNRPLKGATCGCAISTCRKTFHYYCAHHDDQAICRRIEVRNKFTNRVSVLYRVFCSTVHQTKFEKENAQEMVIKYNSDSSDTEYSSGEDNGGDGDTIYSSNITKKSKSALKNDKNGDGDNKAINSDVNQKRAYSPTRKGSHKRLRSDQSENTSDTSVETLPTVTPGTTAKSEDTDIMDGGSAPESEQITELVKSEPITPPTKNKDTPLAEEASADDESDVVLCIMEECHHLEKYGTRIRQMVSRQFNIHESSIHFWSSNGPTDLSPQHMLLFMRDVVKAVYQSNRDTFQRLILRPLDSEIEVYNNHTQYMDDYMNESLSTQIKLRLRNVIGDYFIETNKKMEMEIGGAFMLAELNSIFITLFVDKHLDPGNFIRQRLLGKVHVYPVEFWLDLAAIKQGAEVSEKEQLANREHEMAALSLWLQHEMDEPIKLRIRPKEVILRQTTTMSNTCQLCNLFQRRISPSQLTSGSNIMFIVPVQKEIMKYGMYCREAISAFVQEELTALNPVYCVLDVDEVEGFSCVADIILPFNRNIKTLAFCGLNPTVSPLSCIVLKFYNSM